MTNKVVFVYNKRISSISKADDDGMITDSEWQHVFATFVLF